MGKNLTRSTLALAVVGAMSSFAMANESLTNGAEKDTTQLQTIVLTAEEQVKQSLGASIITDKDLEKLPVVNDISEYVRRMPGVNLTGNSATGQRGNNRQIDIRGMGPENTLILVDGKPVNSRNSVRYGWRGERDTRGDSNWVPADAIESIEVLRGPAAARYGSGAMGGVVNIKTKKVTNEVHGSVEVFTNQPENSKEGSSHRESFNLSGPIIKDVLSYRLYGNYNKTDADAADINPLTESGSRAAGREGVENKDISGRLAWQINDQQSLTLDTSFGRQGNEYTGDIQNSNADATNPDSSFSNIAYVNGLLGKETNTMYRDSYALTHEGKWAWGDTKLLAQFDKTKNKRIPESLAGGPEGSPNSFDKKTSVLDTTRFNAETNIPLDIFFPQALTLGAEWVEDKFSDATSTVQADASGLVQLPSDRTHMKSRIASAYIEDNFKVTDATDLVLGVRFDDHSKSGSNWSPSLNITQKLGDYFTLKGGIARAYKAPNMYQNAEGYLLFTRGNGCPDTTATASGSCYLVGNADLKPETSINKEVGIQFEKDIVNASLTWFRNDYKNKITSGEEVVGTTTVGSTTYHLLEWTNIPKALIQGLEGSVSLDFGNINWTNNFTYMMDSVNKTTGNPLSVVPNYTINSIFNYDITDQFDVNFVYTQYGRQKPRQFAETRNTTMNTKSVPSYGIAGINVGYKFTDQFSGRLGVSNLFDEQLVRNNDLNQTYNEPGRAYYASLKYSF
ncbi:FepA family TonB-dependent siderophore receptor [Acinetobacter johnsonii]|uniref:FepA family TonB-dependent siderophore receptor n=1 Tax=Acinetobacter johnsonii TaxID=40214 RepID=A0AA42XG07_ACIJO|nr:FepA family TonB-dependent siderophore receptor [Acinetobacter johnsonii]MDH0656503.1 FepA family TonB-dependent siderophore receptor [Acinetobacter johnsonii]MDH0835690.1 FepA family TonB-dependent siderophore receptor [Acinetobacter johnsonii]MDH0838552.1 FepA family TonB-dependent siderophore receptor [Acinetobacter johnsonii]MDH2171406.1 FepA family TonB-dependent siderophore receptor [Acinetobacter johnsonii]MDH2174597.1 FepA family TonB-dependent siderophore receptor [Acinetobacter jo